VGVLANLGTQVNRRKRTARLNPNIVKDVSPEWGNKGNGVVIKIRDAGKKAEEVMLNKFFCWDPELLAAVIDNLVLVQVTIDSVGAGRGIEEIGEKVG